MIKEPRKAVDLSSTAYCKTYTYNLRQNEIRRPAYYSDFINCESPDLILITKEWSVVNFIRHLGSRTCMLCQEDPYLYDLSFCCEKEVWVLHRNSETFNSALDLAHTIQRNGAKKISLIKIELRNLQEVKYVGK